MFNLRINFSIIGPWFSPSFLNDLIGNYIYLLIGLLAVTLPIVLLLLNIFSKGINIIRTRYYNQRHHLILFLKLRISCYYGQYFDKHILDLASKALDDLDKATKRKIWWLNPGIQIRNIILSLALAFLFIMTDLLVRDDYRGMYNHSASVALIFLSLASFAVMIFIIWNVTSEIIEVKNLLYKIKHSKKMKGEFSVTEVIGSNIIRVSPNWEYDSSSGDVVIIKGYVCDDDKATPFVIAKLRELFKKTTKIQLVYPEHPEVDGSKQIKCNVWLDTIDISDYFPECTKVTDPFFD